MKQYWHMMQQENLELKFFFFSNKCLKLLYIHVQQDTCLNCFLEKRIIFSIDPTIPNANNVERPYRDV